MSTPYYEDETCAIYHGDVLDVLPLAPVDALITDPPFAFTGGISNGMSGHVSEQFWLHWWSDVCCRITETVVPKGSGFIWCDWRTARSIEKGFQPKTNTYNTWRLAQMLYHYREMPGQGTPFRSSVDMIAYIRGPRHKDPPISNTTHNFLSRYWYYGKHDYHPSEKSVDVAQQFVEWCSIPEQCILDPFMGSGTILVAAKQAGRKSVGVDIEESYCEIAAKRLQQEVMSLL